jgi:hypothetical protein
MAKRDRHRPGSGSAALIAGVLPFIELTLGVALLCGACTLGAAFLTSVLFLMFTFGQASALLRGIDADCGCFGAGEKVGWASLLRTAALLVGSVLCFLWALREHGAASQPAVAPNPAPQPVAP